jgi:hypothetical protein
LQMKRLKMDERSWIAQRKSLLVIGTFNWIVSIIFSFRTFMVLVVFRKLTKFLWKNSAGYVHAL